MPKPNSDNSNIGPQDGIAPKAAPQKPSKAKVTKPGAAARKPVPQASAKSKPAASPPKPMPNKAAQLKAAEAKNKTVRAVATKPATKPATTKTVAGVTTKSQIQQQTLQRLAVDDVVKPREDFAFSSELDESSEYYQSTGFVYQLLHSSRSWMASLVVHVIVIVALAVFTFGVQSRGNIFLEVSSDDDLGALLDLEDVTFESSEEAFELPEANSADGAPELLSMELEFELEAFDTEQFEFADDLSGSSEQLSRIANASSGESLEFLEGGSSFFGIEATGKKIVFIVDRSGSMEGARWVDAKYELLRAISGLTADQEFFVFLFSGTTHPMPRLAGANKMVPATDENKIAFRKWLNRQKPDNSTKPLGSIRRSINMDPDTIFLLTDGMFFDNSVEYLINRATKRAKRTDKDEFVINTIAFYCFRDFEPSLKAIADAYFGTFRSIQ